MPRTSNNFQTSTHPGGVIEERLDLLGVKELWFQFSWD